MLCGTAEFVCIPSKVRHIPVLLDEALAALSPKPGKRFLDCTFGGGGHSEALLGNDATVEVVAMDCDPDAMERASAARAKRMSNNEKTFDVVDTKTGEITLNHKN